MELKDLLDLMDGDEVVEVNDQDIPIDRMTLFEKGTVRRCLEKTEICGATVTGIGAVSDVICILVSRKESYNA